MSVTWSSSFQMSQAAFSPICKAAKCSGAKLSLIFGTIAFISSIESGPCFSQYASMKLSMNAFCSAFLINPQISRVSKPPHSGSAHSGSGIFSANSFSVKCGKCGFKIGVGSPRMPRYFAASSALICWNNGPSFNKD